MPRSPRNSTRRPAGARDAGPLRGRRRGAMVANGPRAEPFARLPRTQLRRIIALRLPPRVTVHRTRTERDTAARSFAIDAWLGRALVEPTGARAELLARVRAPATDGAAARAR